MRVLIYGYIRCFPANVEYLIVFPDISFRWAFLNSCRSVSFRAMVHVVETFFKFSQDSFGVSASRIGLSIWSLTQDTKQYITLIASCFQAGKSLCVVSSVRENFYMEWHKYHKYLDAHKWAPTLTPRSMSTYYTQSRWPLTAYRFTLFWSTIRFPCPALGSGYDPDTDLNTDAALAYSADPDPV